MHPVVLRPAVDGDPRLVNEVFGFVMRCAISSAAYNTDYFVDEGTAATYAGVADWRALADVAERAGYWSSTTVGGQPGWLIVADSDFVHIRLRAELDWERQRDKDRRTPGLVVPVRLRDGDGCRYCGVVVQWNDRKGGRGGTYDHRPPGQAATSSGHLVVSCRACNAGRRDDPAADERYPLLPVPADPYYSSTTVDLLAKHGHHVTPSDPARPGTRPDPAPSPRPRSQRDPALPRPATQVDPAPRDPAAGGTPRPAATSARPASRADPAPTERPANPRASPHTHRDPAPGGPPRTPTPPARSRPADPLDPPNHLTGGSRIAGTGRDGIGSGADQQHPPAPGRRRRARRGGNQRPPDPHQ